MVDVPRRLPPTPEQRLAVVLARMMPGSAAGSTRFARATATGSVPVIRAVAGG